MKEGSGGGNDAIVDGQCDPSKGVCKESSLSPSPLLIRDRGKKFYAGINKPEDPLQLSRHHMCSNSVLRDFWNALVENKYLRTAMSDVFDEMKVICHTGHASAQVVWKGVRACVGCVCMHERDVYVCM